MLRNIALLMINALIFFALLMILHYSLTILNINANALSLIFFINANTLIHTHICMSYVHFIEWIDLKFGDF